MALRPCLAWLRSIMALCEGRSVASSASHTHSADHLHLSCAQHISFVARGKLSAEEDGQVRQGPNWLANAGHHVVFGDERCALFRHGHCIGRRPIPTPVPPAIYHTLLYATLSTIVATTLLMAPATTAHSASGSPSSRQRGRGTCSDTVQLERWGKC